MSSFDRTLPEPLRAFLKADRVEAPGVLPVLTNQSIGEFLLVEDGHFDGVGDAPCDDGSSQVGASAKSLQGLLVLLKGGLFRLHRTYVL